MIDRDEDTDLFRPLDDRTVLFAYDGSEQARASILEAAHRLGPDRCAIVLTVWDPLRQASVEEAATRLACEGASLARSIGFDARPLAASGDPVWRSIVDSAEANDASIVVLASDGSAGGVAAAVARHTERTVLIVPGGRFS